MYFAHFFSKRNGCFGFKMLSLVILSVVSTALATIGATALTLLFAYYCCCCSYFDDAHRTGRRADRHFRAWEGWRALHRAFGAEIVAGYECGDDDNAKDEKANDGRPRLILLGPHGVGTLTPIFLLCWHGNRDFATNLSRPLISRDCRVAAADPLFWVPGMRELALSSGAVSVSRETIERHLTEAPGFTRGGDLVLLPGGAKEMASTRLGHDDLYLGHKGALDAARRLGADVVPAFAHGETDLFHVWSPNWLRPMQRLCMRLASYPFPFLVWPTFLPAWLPGRTARRSLRLIVGRPLKAGDYETTIELHEAFYRSMEILRRFGDGL